MTDYYEALYKQWDLEKFWLGDEGTSVLESIGEKLGDPQELIGVSQRLFGYPLMQGECFYWSPNIVDMISVAARSTLRIWFHAFFLMANTRCGISAKQLQRDTTR